jgi:hypothetical protein
VTIPRKLRAEPRLFAECGFRIQSVVSVREPLPRGSIRARSFSESCPRVGHDRFGKPVSTHPVEARGHAFPDHALALRVPMPMAVAMTVHHGARRTGHLVGPAEIPTVAEYVGAIAAERPGSGRDRRRHRDWARLRHHQRTAGIQPWRRRDVRRRRNLRERRSGRQKSDHERNTKMTGEIHGIILTDATSRELNLKQSAKFQQRLSHNIRLPGRCWTQTRHDVATGSG